MRYREWFIIYDGRYTLRLSRDGYLPEHSTLHGMIIIECELIGFGGFFWSVVEGVLSRGLVDLVCAWVWWLACG